MASYAFWSPLQCNICIIQVGESDCEEFTWQNNWPKKCSSCSLIWYCGREHQLADWMHHRETCKAVKIILTKTDTKHPLELMGEIKSKNDLKDAIKALKITLRQVLMRRLTHVENQLTTFVAHCAVCFSLEKLKPCEDCYAVAYCCKEHAEMHAKEHKPKECKELAIYYSPFRMRKVKTKVKFEHFEHIDNLKGLDLHCALEMATKMKLPLKPTESWPAFRLFNSAADFSSIATICYVMECLNMKDFKEQKFVIFIVGAAIEMELWFQRSHVKYFFSQYPQITELRLHFVGPYAIDKPQIDLHFQFHGAMRHVSGMSYNSTAVDFTLDQCDKPSLMFSFNCGFTDYEAMTGFYQPNLTDIWRPALIKILRTYNVPFAFTSITDSGTKFNYSEVLSAVEEGNGLGKPIEVKDLMECAENPYRDLRPFRNMRFTDAEEFFYRNKYLQVIISTPTN